MPSLVGSEMCIRDRCRAGRSGDQDNPLVPSHCRMRAYDRDLIRGGHYGQRPRVPHLKAEHMAAPTNAANVKKILANPEPSTHGTKRTNRLHRILSPIGCTADKQGFRPWPARPSLTHPERLISAGNASLRPSTWRALDCILH